MKLIERILARRRAKIAEPAITPAQRLAATLKPCPEIRARRLAQMSIERKERYLRNISSIQSEMEGTSGGC